MDVLKYAGYAGKIAKIYNMFSFRIARNAAILLLTGMFFLLYASSAPESAGESARMTPILLTVLWGFLFFQSGAEFLGGRTALMALFLFAFSPAILAQKNIGDIAGALGLFLAVMYFLRSLKENAWKNIIAAGVAFGIAEVFLFTAPLLFLFFFTLATMQAFTQERARSHAWQGSAAKTIKTAMLIFIIGYFAVALPLRQLDIQNHLLISQKETAENIKTAYIIKEPLALYALFITALFLLAIKIKNAARHANALLKRGRARASEFLREYFTLASFALFILFYGIFFSDLLTQKYENIIPILPFIFLLVSSVITDHLRQKPQFAMEFSFEGMKKIASFYKRKALRYALLFLVLAWYLISVLAHYPHFASYTNELADILKTPYSFNL